MTRILTKDHKQLNSYLKATSEWISVETLNSFPDAEPKEYLYDLMRNYSQRGGNTSVLH